MLRDSARHTVERAFQPHDNEWLELWTEAGLTEEARAALAPYRTGLI
jgi:hypothetical protein